MAQRGGEQGTIPPKYASVINHTGVVSLTVGMANSINLVLKIISNLLFSEFRIHKQILELIESFYIILITEAQN